MPFFLPTATTRTLGLGLSLTSAAAFAIHHHSPSSRRQQSFLHCESPLSSSSSSSSSSATDGGRGSSSFRTYTERAKVPVLKRDGSLNPAMVKQVSSGSLLGLMGGVAVSTFSKTLALVFGMLVLSIQFAASKGYNIIPTARIQRYVKGIDLRSAVEDNVAFKLSFGVTFVLAALAKFE